MAIGSRFTLQKETAMIELKHDRLVFSFPEVHPKAKLTIGFQRTLRIPDDDRSYPLPPGLGVFPVRHVDDHAAGVPATWLQRGGVMMPIYQAEALWLRFDAEHIDRRETAYPFAIKVATGKHCAVSGDAWRDGLTRNPQNYMVAPKQPWLDGYVVEKGKIRQFVAMPLGAGYTAEEQISGKAEHGGLQLAVYPMNRLFHFFTLHFWGLLGFRTWVHSVCGVLRGFGGCDQGRSGRVVFEHG